MSKRIDGFAIHFLICLIKHKKMDRRRNERKDDICMTFLPNYHFIKNIIIILIDL